MKGSLMANGNNSTAAAEAPEGALPDKHGREKSVKKWLSLSLSGRLPVGSPGSEGSVTLFFALFERESGRRPRSPLSRPFNSVC